MVTISATGELWLAIIRAYRANHNSHPIPSNVMVAEWLTRDSSGRIQCCREPWPVSWEITIPDHLYLILVLKYAHKE